MQLELLLLINSQACKVGKCSFYVNYKRIPPCIYNKIAPNRLKEKQKLLWLGRRSLPWSASSLVTPSLAVYILAPWFSALRDFGSPGTFGNVWKHFQCRNWWGREEVILGI